MSGIRLSLRKKKKLVWPCQGGSISKSSEVQPVHTGGEGKNGKVWRQKWSVQGC